MKRKFLSIVLMVAFVLIAFAITDKVYAATVANVSAITSPTSATITGNETNDVTVYYNNPVVVEWDLADTSIGRYQDAGWLGVKITAPTGMDLTQVKYQSYSASGWSADKSFWNNKDSADDATEHYINVWVPLKPEYLEGRTTDLVWKYQFDWDNDGNFEQLITIKVSPDVVTLVNNDGIILYPTLVEGIPPTVSDKELEDMYTEEKEEELTNTETDEKDDTPKTGSVNIILYVSIIFALVSLSGIVLTKKYVK